MPAAIETFQVVGISRIGKRVKVCNLARRRLVQQKPNERRANKTRTACNKEFSHVGSLVSLDQSDRQECKLAESNSN